MSKVIKIENSTLVFDDGKRLYSYHDTDCCESHELTLNDLTINDFDNLEFDLESDSFFKRIDGFGIELIPINGFPVRIPGHGYNNGYYSSNLSLVISKDYIVLRKYDITECQIIRD